jgi:hypothetical protein
MNIKYGVTLTILLYVSGVYASGGTFYKFKDENGELVITSSIPPEKAKFGYEIIDKNGRVIETIDGELSEEGLSELQQKQRKEKEEKELESKRQEYDLSLVRRYSFAADIEAEKKRKLAELKATLSIVKGNLNSIRTELDGVYSQAANIEREGKNMPAALQKKISELEAALISTEDLYKIRQKNIEEVDLEYERAIARFNEIQELRGRKKTAQ